MNDPKLYAVYGYTLDNAVNRRGATVIAESENQALVKATNVLNSDSLLRAGLPYFWVTHAVEIDLLSLKYPSKIGDDF